MLQIESLGIIEGDESGKNNIVENLSEASTVKLGYNELGYNEQKYLFGLFR
jgi:hypothetical protein